MGATVLRCSGLPRALCRYPAMARAVRGRCSRRAVLLLGGMPTFTDASLVAAGSGFLLWALLATEAGPRRRTWVGLAGFLALEAATFVRYTNLVILACAVVTVLVAWRLRAVTLPSGALGWWLSSVAAF